MKLSNEETIPSTNNRKQSVFVVLTASLLLTLALFGMAYHGNHDSTTLIRDGGNLPVNKNASSLRNLQQTHLERPTKLNAIMDQPRTLNVHVVPHTHDDVGWLKTVEQYYFGQNMTIQHACVKDILDTVVSSLLENPSRTFTYVEIKFFSMWWNRQTDAVKDDVRYLVANKQLSFANGGWCMHDEAATHYIGMIDQTTLGHQFLSRELGVIPKVGWQLDPFGHSSTQAALMTSKLGFNSLFFGRIDYQDLQVRRYTKNCEGLWNSSQNVENSTVFWGLTGSYSGNYGSPRGYCFDIRCEDPLLTDYNNTELEHSIHKFLEEIRIQSDRTRGNHILLTMGEDFNYQRAHTNFANMDLLISEIMTLQKWNRVDIPALMGSQYDKVNIFYSSPDYYTQCKYEEWKASSKNVEGEATVGTQDGSSGRKLGWPVKKDDFMPYSDCQHCFWTGYFTSRPALKRLERVSSSFLLSSRQILTAKEPTNFENPSLEHTDSLHILEDAVAVAQHHDGVSGTSKQHVANDYAKRLQAGIDAVSPLVAAKLRRLMLGTNASDYLNNLSFCQLLNETTCAISQDGTKNNNTKVYVVVQNGMAYPRSNIVHLPVSIQASYRVQEVGNSSNSMLVKAIPEFASHVSSSCCNDRYRISFNAGVNTPLGFSIFEVHFAGRMKMALTTSQTSGESSWSVHRNLQQESSPPDVVASNQYISVTFDGSTGQLKEMTTAGTTVPIQSFWGYYTSFDQRFDTPMNPDTSSDARDLQNSGAYIFRPSTPDQALNIVEPVSSVFFNTSAGFEVHTTYEVPWIRTVTRVGMGQPYLEVDYTVGPIPAGDMRGKEIVTRLQTPIKSSSTFYTDSNGREFMKRVRDSRPTWELNVYEPVAGNYYPVNAAIYIEDKESAIAVATDRSQGGASLQDGAVELMVHRRTLIDDARGVFEAINETTGGMTPYPPFGNATRQGDGIVIKGQHRILVGGPSGGASSARLMMDAALVDPLIFVASAPADQDVPFNISSETFDPLPQNVFLLTRTFLDGDGKRILLRVAHQFGKGEHYLLSDSVEVDLAKLVPGYEVKEIQEMTLSANQLLSTWEANRLDWTGSISSSSSQTRLDGTTITLGPMDIRTFVITLK
eukprot:Nitzschia sp. Nitz4//scaffold272_size25479//12374//15946//NITZ4_008309-RA/size25479-snap-gene-0.1-mRNA-1//-1//CDS//3329545225//2959//frame0